ncbi:class I SAM-dependent methyltransferase [Aquibium sp. LZ166]|uniref:Class I SAM-dependent methyltransferase n=1 Tax=Aquibium pacificus TaxID=3153579 RepID=A0ABV3SDP2_9HYPH
MELSIRPLRNAAGFGALASVLLLASVPLGFAFDHILPLPFEVARIDNQLAHKLVPIFLVALGLVYLASAFRRKSPPMRGLNLGWQIIAATPGRFDDPARIGVFLLCLGVAVAVHSPWIIVLVLLSATTVPRWEIGGGLVSAGYDPQTPAIYHRLHGRFLRLSGGEGQSAVEGAVSALLRPGMSILDAGCGTGQLARNLLQAEPGIRLTLLDCNDMLLDAARDLPATRIHADMRDIPLEDGRYDLTLALWSIEATDDVEAAISELVRVTRAGGQICLLFCARTDQSDVLDRLIEWGIRVRNTGHFLEPDRVTASLKSAGVREVKRLACRGPVAAILATK